MGRPTKYKPEHCAAIVAFFSVEPYEEQKTIYGIKRSSNKLPTFAAFARSIGVNEDTVVQWSKKHEEFTAAYNAAKGLQKDFLIQNGLAGLYPPAFAIFTAKNITDMTDRTETDITSKGQQIGAVILPAKHATPLETTTQAGGGSRKN